MWRSGLALTGETGGASAYFYSGWKNKPAARLLAAKLVPTSRLRRKTCPAFALLVSYPTPLGAYERISSLLSAINGNNSRRHHAGIGAHQVRNQFVEYFVSVSTGRFSNGSGNTASGGCTYGQLHTQFEERIQGVAPVRQLRAVIGYIEQVGLCGFLGFRIDKIGPLRNWDSVLRPDRIVI